MTDSSYNAEELVYTDPDNRVILGPAEWDQEGNLVSKKYPRKEEGRSDWRTTFPCGTFRSMSNIWLRKGKRKEDEGNLTLDEALPKALSDQL